ncbi:MAG: DUF2304 domain-containing protein [Anaerolineae bacterium]|nr:DUF2304 domain-containing protein [Anaerolineae bacterium]MCB9130071.1 DUF2304 domain-containing protein [Anaerolineales bacterium]MCB0241211.1 DUF2304 domain-containing protein [Anaerolineae bacterium]MCB0247347.1 DUF2304 domain-containing protein [Anaerolineae bacterium]MCB9142630.1 DUF2304 domain-containing protein [Anaerolineales bacterium]
MIDPRSRLLLFLMGLAVLILVINLVRKRQLQERYALLWLLAGLVLTLAPLFSNVLDRIAYALGIDYPPALLLLLAIIGLMLIIFQLSLAISHNSDQLKVLSQELGLLRQQLDKLQREQVAQPEHLPDNEDGTDADQIPYV